MLDDTRPNAFSRMPVDLFRLGNAQGPRLDNVRSRDVEFVEETMPNGVARVMVKPLGGISTFDRINPRLRGSNWWRLPAGTVIPPALLVTFDRRDPQTGIAHYLIRPISYMSLAEFLDALRALARAAKPVIA
jgi:hypothetical protein